MKPPKGKHIFGTVKVGEKGQIVIPKDARKVFNIQPGDSLVVLGDEASGIAILKSEMFMEQIADAVFRKKRISHDDNPDTDETYEDIMKSVQHDAGEEDE